MRKQHDLVKLIYFYVFILVVARIATHRLVDMLDHWLTCEQEVGEALKKKIGNSVKREELWLTSKLWNTFHKQEDVIPALKQSLAVC